MASVPGDERRRDGAVADEIDRVGDDRPPKIDPLEGLLDPEEGSNTPASDSEAPPPG